MEGAGSAYSIDEWMVHSVSPLPDTFSLVVQGPRTKGLSLRTSAPGEIILKGGRADESAPASQQVAATVEGLRRVRDLGRRLGLVR